MIGDMLGLTAIMLILTETNTLDYEETSYVKCIGVKLSGI